MHGILFLIVGLLFIMDTIKNAYFGKKLLWTAKKQFDFILKRKGTM
jgi:hypothetical protein